LGAPAVAEFAMVRVGDSLKCLPEGLEDFNKIGEGEIVKAVVTISRDLVRHRKFFALLKVAFDNQDFYATFEQFRQAVLIGLGWCETFILQSGEVCYQPKSISFARMDEAKFSRVYSDVLDYLIRTHVPGCDPREMSSAAMRILEFV